MAIAQLPHPGIMLITDVTQATLPLEDVIIQSLAAGCKWIVLRDIGASDDALLKQAQFIKKLCTASNAKLFIGRSANVAKAINADGLHLSASQNPNEARALCSNMIIGQSCHSLDEIVAAQQHGVDYATLSPIFETSSKPGYGPALGLQTLVHICKQTTLPVIALGGIDADKAITCRQAGASGVAVMGSIMRSLEPKTSMQRILYATQNL